ncbi:MAG: DUF1573 domain-containing protein [Bacteroidota bacterium]
MRFHLLLLGIVLISGSWTPSTPPTKVMEWVGEVDHDFGDIPHGVPVSFDFQFRNITENPLLIDNVRTTCGCTASEWEDYPTDPGGVGEINVEFNAKKRGYFYKKVRVFFNGQRKGELLTIQGYVED